MRPRGLIRHTPYIQTIERIVLTYIIGSSTMKTPGRHRIVKTLGRRSN